jgi:thiol-disulfide isomerase/thioredoxin
MHAPFSRYLFIFLIIASSASVTHAQRARVVRFPELQQMMKAKSDTTYIFNFFATWCDPCVKEFPNFQKLAEENRGKKFKLVFVSLDFRNKYKKVLLPFLKKRHVTNDVLLLDEPDYNTWIDKVDPNWNGNLPMTLAINNARHIREIYPHDFTYDSLRKTIEPFVQ